MSKISVVISAYNEEEKLPECLASVSFADEIIVIDNQSTDRTIDVAKKFKAKVFSRPNNLMLNINKNFGFTKATGDWILNLDADERVPSELAQEITEIVGKGSPDAFGFAMPRKNFIFGKWMQHTGWYPDYQLRLFRKGKGKFAEKHVHEQLGVEGSIERLRNPLIHENYQSIIQFLQKLFIVYAPNEADNILQQEKIKSLDDQIKYEPYVFDWKDAVSNAIGEFIQRFYAQKGYKDGVHGLMLSVLMGFYHFVIYAYVWEKQKFVDNEKSILSQVKKELSPYRKLGYWQVTAEMEETTNPLKKVYYRIRRKIVLIFPNV